MNLSGATFSFGRHRPEVRRGDARVPSDDVGQGLVHAERGALDVAAYVGDARQLQQTLDGAVFAELAVQDGEHQIETDRLITPLSRTSNPRALLSGDSTAGRDLPFSQFGFGPSQSLHAPLS